MAVNQLDGLEVPVGVDCVLVVDPPTCCAVTERRRSSVAGYGVSWALWTSNLMMRSPPIRGTPVSLNDTFDAPDPALAVRTAPAVPALGHESDVPPVPVNWPEEKSFMFAPAPLSTSVVIETCCAEPTGWPNQFGVWSVPATISSQIVRFCSCPLMGVAPSGSA